jgi:hypothetical protein
MDLIKSFTTQRTKLAHFNREVNAMHGIGRNQLVGHQNLSVHDVESGVLEISRNWPDLAADQKTDQLQYHSKAERIQAIKQSRTSANKYSTSRWHRSGRKRMLLMFWHDTVDYKVVILRP